MEHSDTLRMLGSLAGILALIFALAWVARRTGWLRARGSAGVRVVATQSLGNTRASVALVEVEGARLVLGVTATQVNLLHTLPAAHAVTGHDFAAVLQEAS